MRKNSAKTYIKGAISSSEPLYTLSYLSQDFSDVGQWSVQSEDSNEDDVFSDTSSGDDVFSDPSSSLEEDGYNTTSSESSRSSVSSSSITSDSNTTWSEGSVSWSNCSTCYNPFNDKDDSQANIPSAPENIQGSVVLLY